MLTRHENVGGQAHLRYDDGEFHVLVPGSHVICAITGRHIQLDELRYWSVSRQEAYADVHASVEAERRAGTVR
ncbi:MAG: DUF2093 domain-containing protein [Pseudomonadota bacterium]